MITVKVYIIYSCTDFYVNNVDVDAFLMKILDCTLITQIDFLRGKKAIVHNYLAGN